jgi:hypothetical protein
METLREVETLRELTNAEVEVVSGGGFTTVATGAGATGGAGGSSVGQFPNATLSALTPVSTGMLSGGSQFASVVAVF